MLFKVNQRIFYDYPGVTIGLVIAHDIDNTQEIPEVKKLLELQEKKVKELLKEPDIVSNQNIALWRAAYKKFGAKPDKHLSSIENLITRIVAGHSIPYINTLTALYNFISLKYLLPSGGEDLDTIVGNLELRHAEEHEKPVILLGQKEARPPEKGEVIYVDDQGAVCRRWNWKESERTKLTKQTGNAILVIEGLQPISSDVVESAINELAYLIEQYCGGTATVALINEQHASVALKKNNSWVSLNQKQKKFFAEHYFSQLYSKHISDDFAHDQDHSLEHQTRLKKIEQLRQQGTEPWPAAKAVDNTCAQVIEEFQTTHNPEKIYTLAGRLMIIREHGKTAFAVLQDVTGKLQLYLKKDILGEQKFAFFMSAIDIGDIVWVSGTSFKTKMGEITLNVTDVILLSKCLHPLPEKFHGLTDVETIYRQRYLDLITNPESKERFVRRTKLLKGMRAYLDEHGFMEVETPMLHPIAGGAAAKPFTTHHNALHSDFYLRIAPELYLKRLVVGGFERVYEINRNFRNEGISTRHNPEFTMLEFYMAHHDYQYVMNFVENMLKDIMQESTGTLEVRWGQHTIHFDKPFERLSPQQALQKYAHLKAQQLAPDTINATLQQHNVVLENKQVTFGQKIFALFEALVEPLLIQPTFIVDFPIEISPLAKRDPNNPAIAARFELFIAGMEIANGFNELNDPLDQAERFKEQVKAHKAGDPEAHQYDQDYITALEYGLPPAVGVGIGIDRLTMLATNTTSIKDVILFPTLKKK